MADTKSLSAAQPRKWVPVDEPQAAPTDQGPAGGSSEYDQFIARNKAPNQPAVKPAAPDSQRLGFGQFVQQAADSTIGAALDAGSAVAGMFKPEEASLPVSESTSPRVVDTGGLPIDQGVFTQLKAELGAMPREQRLATVNLPGWKGRAAKVAVEQLDNEQAGVDRLKLGAQSPTLEGRAGYYAGQGANHEVATLKATSDLVADAPGSNLHFASDGGQRAADDAQAVADGRSVQQRSLAARGGYAAMEGLKAGTQGVAAAAMRAIGDDETANALELSARRSKIRVDSANELVSMRRRAQEAGTVLGNDGYWEDMAVGGISSAAQNAPQILAGVAMTALTDNPVLGARLSMSLMTGQSFGDEYMNGRMAGMTPGKAASRAGIMAGFEYLGERYGLIPSAMKAVRGSAPKVPLEELPQFLERFVGALEKRGVLGPQIANVARGQLGEQFGEQLTTAGQYWVDGTELGLDKPVSISGYLEAARDTAVQTLISTGVLQAAGSGMTKLVDPSGHHHEAGAGEAAKAEAIGKWQQAFATPVDQPREGANQSTHQHSAPEPAAAVPAVHPSNQPEAQSSIAEVPQGSLASEALGTVSSIDEAAHQAATSPTNDLPEPTQAQKEAGNYKVGRTRIGGMDIRIENPEGSVRTGVDADGTPWETQMRHHYGYFSGTMAADGDKLDVFVKPGLSEDWSGPVFVIDQVDPKTGKLDEHKVVMGAADQSEAEQIYRSNYADDWQGMGAITKLPLPAFKAWAKSGRLKEALGDISGQAELAKNRKLASSANTAQPIAPTEPAVAHAETAPVVAPPTIAGKPVTELQTGQLLRYAKMASASERVRRVAAEEVKRRETEAMWKQREQERQAQEASIVSEAKDQQVEQAIAASNASETEAPTAMASAFAKAMNKKESTSEPHAQEALNEAAAPQTNQEAIDRTDPAAPEVGAEPAGVSGVRPAATETTGLTEAEQSPPKPAQQDAVPMAKPEVAEPKPEAKKPDPVPAPKPKLGKEVSRDTGQFKEGMSEFRANQVKAELAKKNPRVSYSVEFDPELKHGYVVVGRAAVAADKKVATPAEQSNMPKAVEPAAGNLLSAPAENGKQIGRSPSPTAEKSLIADAGEKIGGARKDTATKVGVRASGTSDDTPGWRRRYVAMQSMTDMTQDARPWHLLDKKTGKMVRSGYQTMSFPSEAEAEQAIPLVEVARSHRVTPSREQAADGSHRFVITRDVSDRKRVQVVAKEFASRDEALHYMYEHATEIIETKTSFGEEILPKPENAMRTGEARRQGDAKADDFIRDFGLRAVEFGNWNNQDERQDVMNYAYDAMGDLAEVIGVNPKALGLGGQLGLAFGARGQGLSGARAHYEIQYGAINLTKMSGAGSLGHEWFHALDHYFARQDGKTPGTRTANDRGDMVFDVKPGADKSMASHGFLLRGSGVRQEVRDAYQSLITTMFKKAETYVEDTKATERFVGSAKTDLARQLQSLRDNLSQELDPKYFKRNNKPASADQLATFDAIAEQLIAGEGLSTSLKMSDDGKRRRGVMSGARWTNDALEQISTILKAVRGVNGFRADRSGTLDSLRSYLSRYEQRLKMLADAQSANEKQRSVPTSFAMEAKSIDQGRASDYWTTPHEMAARAFEAFVTDKVAERGNQSDFLAYGTNSAVLTPWGWKRPYPHGAERQAIGKAFDKFLSTLETQADESGHISLFSVQDTAGSGVVIDKAELDQVINRNLRSWKSVGISQIVAVESWKQLPEEVLKGAEDLGLKLSKLEGVLHRGRVYVVRSAIGSAEQVERILFHEILGHMGLAAALNGKVATTLDRLWNNMNGLAGVAKLAKRHEAEPGVTVWHSLQKYIKGTEFSDPASRRYVIMNELVATLAQANDTTALTQFKTYLSDLKQSVVQLLRRFGLNPMADRLEQFASGLDVLALVRDARQSIIGGKTKDGTPFTFVANGQSLTPAFSEIDDSKFSVRDDSPVNLPDAIIGTSLGAAASHPDYTAAKAGDESAAIRLASDLVTPGVVEKVRQAVAADVLVLPVTSEEATGRNKIPLGVAEVLAERLGTTTSTDVVQASRVHRTQLDGMGRLFASPEFTGAVEKGRSYLLVDDTLTQGGTFAALASHITQNGGQVAGVFALTGKQYSAKLALSPDLLSKIRETYSDVEPAFRAATGRGFNSLTESEARYLAKHDAPDAVRNRILEEGRQGIQHANESDAQGQQEGLTGDGRPLFSAKTQGFSLPEFGRTGRFIEAIQNRYNRWKQAVEAVRAQGGTVKEANDFYQAEERYWGIVGAQLDDFKDDVGDFVKGVQADGLELDDVALYAYAKHAAERNAAIAKINPAMPDGGSGMTDSQAQAIIDSAKHAGFESQLEKHAAELNKWSEGTRQVLLKNGLISQAEYDQWTGAYQHYVPLRGQIGDDGSRRGAGAGFDIRGQESFRAMGRRSQAGHIIEHILQDRARALIRSGKNDVLRRFARFVMDNPDKSLWEVNAVERKRSVVDTATGEQVVERDTVNKDSSNTVALKDGGQTIYITVRDAELVKQLKNLHDEASLPVVVESLQWANRLLSRMYTSLSPVFTILNGARDITAGSINMVGLTGWRGARAMLANLPSSLAEAWRGEFNGRPSSAYQEYRRTGGKTGFMDFKDIDGYTKELAKLAQESQSWRAVARTPGALAKARATWVRSRGSARHILNRIEDVNGAIENATRFAAFKAARDAGKSVAESASIAKNITVNFNRRGSMTPVIGSWFLFFNPAVQGTARLAEALKSKNVLATIGTGMAGIFALALTNAAVGGDDDDDGMTYWDKIPDEVKERNLVIMMPPGSDVGESIPETKYGRYIKIPMPYGYNTFAVIAYTLADLLRNQSNPTHGVSMAAGAKRIGKSFIGSWIPVSDVAPSLENTKAVAMIGVPDALDPIVEAALNINSFGKQLYPEGMGQDRLPDSEKVFGAQKNTWKHDAARWINEATGGSQYHEGAISVTPATIDNLVRGYGGGVASFITSVADTMVTQGVARDRVEWWRAPFVKQLYGEVDSMQDQALAYDHMQQIEQSAEPLKRAMRAGDSRAAEAIAKEFGEVSKLGHMAEAARNRLTMIRKNEVRVMESETLTTPEKNVSLRQWDRQRQKVYDSVNQAYNQAIKAGASQ